MIRRRTLLVLTGAVLLVLQGCSEGLTGPSDPGARDVSTPVLAELPSGERLPALSWRTPVREPVSARREAVASGTLLRLGTVPATLWIPAGAIDPDVLGDGIPADGQDDLTISIQAEPGTAVAFEFGPHGLHFDRPAVLAVPVSALSLDPAQLERIQAVYYEEAGTGLIEGREVLPVEIVGGNLLLRLEHFSGYILVSG